MAIACQMCGIDSVMFYSNDIFRATGMESLAQYLTTSIGLLQIVVTLFSSSLIEFTGRRRMYLTGFAITLVSLGTFIFAIWK